MRHARRNAARRLPKTCHLTLAIAPPLLDTSQAPAQTTPSRPRVPLWLPPPAAALPPCAPCLLLSPAAPCSSVRSVHSLSPLLHVLPADTRPLVLPRTRQAQALNTSASQPSAASPRPARRASLLSQHPAAQRSRAGTRPA